MREAYFPGLNNSKYESEEEQIQTWMRFLDMLAFLAFEVDGERVATFLDVDSIEELIGPESRSGVSNNEFDGADGLYELFQLLFMKGIDEEKQEPMFPLSRVLAGLLPLQMLAVLLALAGSINRKYERVVKPLQSEQAGIVRPTVGLCLDLAWFFLDKEERDRSLLLSEDAFVNCYFLKPQREKEYSELSRPLALRPLVLDIILGKTDSVGSLSACYIPIPKVEAVTGIHSRERGELRQIIYNTMRGAEIEDFDRTIVELSGDEGIGKRTVAAMVTAEFGLELLCVDVNRLLFLSDEDQEKCVVDIVVKCALEDRILYLSNFSNAPQGEFSALVGKLQRNLTVIIIGAVQPEAKQITRGFIGMLYRLPLEEIGAPEQKLLWQQMSDRRGLIFDEEISLDEIVSKYTMNPGKICEVLDSVRLCSKPFEGEEISGRKVDGGCFRVTKDELERQIRSASSVEFGENATLLRSPFEWEDLMIDEHGEKLLRIAADRVKYRSVVNENYGFGKKLPYGRGLAIVFYGPPGTGKTMAAQVLANDLGLDIYRIDLSQISSKYIGETEKNLGAVFEAAKNSNAILFFDEADSLFAKRTDVSSSNDKHANAQTSYLLQKIEEYSGLSVLATNNLQNFDAAFKRRMTYLIPIEAPDEETRLRLWKKVFPAEAPLDEKVDLALLAREVRLSGSSIKSAAIAAAYRAAAKNKKIGYDELIESIDLECIKSGELGVGARLSQAVVIEM